MTTTQHVRRLGLLMVAVSALLTWLIAHTDVFFADGLRYIAQAKTIDHGSWTQGLVRSVDHPVYPMAIAAVHRLLGGNRSPRLANRRASCRRDLRSFARHSDLPGEPRGHRALERLAGLFLDLPAPL